MTATPRARSATGWTEMASQVAEVALDGPWLVGDWLNDAERFGLDDQRTTALNSDARWESSCVADLQFVAARFPRSKRTFEVPWHIYLLVAPLADADATRILQRAARERLSPAAVKSAVAEAKKDGEH